MVISYVIISRSTHRVHICEKLFIFQLKESICVTIFETSFPCFRCKKGRQRTPCVHDFFASQIYCTYMLTRMHRWICIYVYIHIYIWHTHIYINIYLCVHIQALVHIRLKRVFHISYALIHIYVNIYTYVCVHLYIYICVYIYAQALVHSRVKRIFRTHMHKYTYMYTYVGVFIHICTYTHRPWYTVARIDYFIYHGHTCKNIHQLSRLGAGWRDAGGWTRLPFDVIQGGEDS